jgi:hypothetical protein
MTFTSSNPSSHYFIHNERKMMNQSRYFFTLLTFFVKIERDKGVTTKCNLTAPSLILLIAGGNLLG